MSAKLKEIISQLLIAILFLLITLIIHFSGLAIYVSKIDWMEIEIWKFAIVPTAIAFVLMMLLIFSPTNQIALKRFVALIVTMFLFVLYFMEGGIILSNYSCSWLGVYAFYLMRFLGMKVWIHYTFMTLVILINGIYLYFSAKLSTYIISKIKST